MSNIFTKSLQNVHLIRYLCRSVNTQTQSKKPQWDLITAVCIERSPVITRKLGSLETSFQDMLHQIELENSLKSDHELRKANDKKQADRLKAGGDISQLDVDTANKQTAQDFEDACVEEYNAFESTQTNSDLNNDLTSLRRRLDSPLLLLVKQNVGPQDHFLPPQGLRQPGETMRQAAERVLIEKCGDNLKAQFFGNAPSGFYKYKYPQDVRNTGETVGAKVFFFTAQLVSGQVVDDKKVSFKWLDRTELEKELPQTYYNSVKQFLIDEDKPE